MRFADFETELIQRTRETSAAHTYAVIHHPPKVGFAGFTPEAFNGCKCAKFAKLTLAAIAKAATLAKAAFRAKAAFLVKVATRAKAATLAETAILAKVAFLAEVAKLTKTAFLAEAATLAKTAILAKAAPLAESATLAKAAKRAKEAEPIKVMYCGIVSAWTQAHAIFSRLDCVEFFLCVFSH